MSAVAKNIVLVHGAFGDGSSWSKVIPLLEEKGCRALRPETLSSSIKCDWSRNVLFRTKSLVEPALRDTVPNLAEFVIVASDPVPR